MKHQKEYYYIKNNSPETREELRHAGYKVCHCASFVDAKWLSVYPNRPHFDCLEMTVHGIGCGCENECEGMCPDKCIMCALSETKATIHIFTDVKSFLNYEKVQSESHP